jgi:hypothetical protein
VDPGDREARQAATLRVAPELADPVGPLEVQEYEDVEQFGAGQESQARAIQTATSPGIRGVRGCDGIPSESLRRLGWPVSRSPLVSLAARAKAHILHAMYDSRDLTQSARMHAWRHDPGLPLKRKAVAVDASADRKSERPGRGVPGLFANPNNRASWGRYRLDCPRIDWPNG